MKKLYSFVIFLLLSFSVLSQSSLNCEGSACLADPLIIPENVLVCNLDSSFIPGADSLGGSVGIITDDNNCYEICEYSTVVYKTEFNPGSIYTWNVSGNQSYTTNNNGNEIIIAEAKTP